MPTLIVNEVTFNDYSVSISQITIKEARYYFKGFESSTILFDMDINKAAVLEDKEAPLLLESLKAKMPKEKLSLQVIGGRKVNWRLPAKPASAGQIKPPKPIEKKEKEKKKDMGQYSESPRLTQEEYWARVRAVQDKMYATPIPGQATLEVRWNMACEALGEKNPDIIAHGKTL